MGNVRRTLTTTLTATLLLSTAACGDPKEKPATAHSSAAPSSPTPSSAVPRSASPSSAAPSSSSARGVLFLVPADEAGKCSSRSHPLGVTCDATGTAYRFQPQAVRRVQVTDAAVVRADSGQWAVDIAFDAAGRRTLARITRSAASAREYLLLMTNRSGAVISAPQVQQPITGGEVEIVDPGDQVAAQRIVNQITRRAR